MDQDLVAFWSEIKKHEETLVKEPKSYCFAPLAELYRKVGQLDDAIKVATRGCEMHPDYVGGHMALGRAYYEKGMKQESRGALEKVVQVTPDNILAQKLLSQIYIDMGATDAAEKSLRTILADNPGDAESLKMLDSLAQSGASSADKAGRVTAALDNEDFFTVPSAEAELMTSGGAAMKVETEMVEDDECILEDAELLELDDDDMFGEEIAVETQPAEEQIEIKGLPSTPAAPHQTAPGESRDPLSTTTLAELYVSQGFLKRAMTIYRELVETEPSNEDYRQRLMELKDAIDQDQVEAREHALDDTDLGIEEAASPLSTMTQMPADAIGSETAVQTLERWLENIKRRR